MATNPLPNELLESQQVYSATYSNVPVYEFITPNGSVMRRKSDGWVNATHILKVANFPKAKRTRILEKDVQTGLHEKVQGGYGKYQGTWVPLERAIEIANEFEVDQILAPIFNFRKVDGSLSPPPAPKHHNASSKASKLLSMTAAQNSTKAATPVLNKLVSAKKMASFPLSKVTKTESVSSSASTSSKLANKRRGRPPKSVLLLLLLLQSMQDHPDYSPPPQLPPIVNSLPKPETRIPNNNFYRSDAQYQYSSDRVNDQPMIHHPSSSPSDFMSDTDLAAALRSPEQSFQSNKTHQQQQRYNNGDQQNLTHLQLLQQQQQQLHQLKKYQLNLKIQQDQDDDMDEEDYPSWYQAYRNSLLEYFHTPDDGLTDTPLPEFFTNPPPGFDINHGVDKENNTALHWACAVGDLRITDALLQCGANANILNNDGLIPIMRSVLFTNPFERRTFAKLLELLRESLLSISQDAKTILHLIALSTNSKIRLNAARYYMEMLLGKISAYHPRETVVNYVNKQDNDGNTALHLISRNSVKKYLKILIPYGARIDIPNKLGERVEDFLQHELIPSGSTTSTFQETQHFQLSQPQQQQPNIGINPYYQNFNNHLTSASLTTSIPRILPVPHFSELAIQANQVVSNQMMEGLDNLANAFDYELQQKDEEISEIKSMMTSLTREINEIEINLGRYRDIQELKKTREEEYEIRQYNLKKLLERSQSKDLATLVQISEQELTNNEQEEDEEEMLDINDEMNNVIALTLFQFRRRQLVDKMLLTIASNQNYQIDKYKHLMKLCLKGSLEEGHVVNVDENAAGGDTDNDEEDETNKNGKLKSEKLKSVIVDDQIDEDLLLDELINNLDPY